MSADAPRASRSTARSSAAARSSRTRSSSSIRSVGSSSVGGAHPEQVYPPSGVLARAGAPHPQPHPQPVGRLGEQRVVVDGDEVCRRQPQPGQGHGLAACRPGEVRAVRVGQRVVEVGCAGWTASAGNHGRGPIRRPAVRRTPWCAGVRRRRGWSGTGGPVEPSRPAAASSAAAAWAAPPVTVSCTASSTRRSPRSAGSSASRMNRRAVSSSGVNPVSVSRRAVGHRGGDLEPVAGTPSGVGSVGRVGVAEVAHHGRAGKQPLELPPHRFGGMRTRSDCPGDPQCQSDPLGVEGDVVASRGGEPVVVVCGGSVPHDRRGLRLVGRGGERDAAVAEAGLPAEWLVDVPVETQHAAGVVPACEASPGRARPPMGRAGEWPRPVGRRWRGRGRRAAEGAGPPARAGRPSSSRDELHHPDVPGGNGVGPGLAEVVQRPGVR